MPWRPLGSTGSPGAGSPASSLLWAALTPGRPSRLALVSLCSAVPRLRVLVRSPSPRHASATGPGLSCLPGALVPGPSVEEMPGPPRFLGDPRARAPLSDPGGASAPDPVRRVGGASHQSHGVGLHEMPCFRGSITRLTRSLCTLRSRGHPSTTQHSLPAGGSTLAGWDLYPRGSKEGFRHFLGHGVLLLQALPGAREVRARAPIESRRRAIEGLLAETCGSQPQERGIRHLHPFFSGINDL